MVDGKNIFIIICVIVLILIAIGTSIGTFYIGKNSIKCPECPKCETCKTCETCETCKKCATCPVCPEHSEECPVCPKCPVLTEYNPDNLKSFKLVDKTKTHGKMFSMYTKYFGSNQYIHFENTNVGNELVVSNKTSCDPDSHCKFTFHNTGNNNDTFYIEMSYKDGNGSDKNGLLAMWDKATKKTSTDKIGLLDNNRIKFYTGDDTSYTTCGKGDCDFKIYKYGDGYVIKSGADDGILTVTLDRKLTMIRTDNINNVNNIAEPEAIFYFDPDPDSIS